MIAEAVIIAILFIVFMVLLCVMNRCPSCGRIMPSAGALQRNYCPYCGASTRLPAEIPDDRYVRPVSRKAPSDDDLLDAHETQPTSPADGQGKAKAEWWS